MYKINIQIINDDGNEVLDKQIQVKHLDELQFNDPLGYSLAEEAKKNEEIDGTFSSKDEVEFNKEDII